VGVLFILTKKHSMFLLLACILGIFLAASVSAADLNETLVSQIDGESNNIGEIDQSQEELSTNEIDENEGLSTNHTPTSSLEIQRDVDDANDGDTIILDGYYLLNGTITVNKTLNFVGKNNAIVDGNNAMRLFMVSKDGVTFKNITFKMLNQMMVVPFTLKMEVM
jgi:hypothetical protein